MSSFFVELWEGIFTPGPTPTILKATNITFAALQVVLLSLLFATYSVHFVVLSALCGGLWWSINWFARELTIAQAAEAERKKKEEEQRKRQGGGDGSGSSDTEVEGKVARRTTRSSKKSAAAAAAGPAAVKADVEPLENKGEVKQRTVLEPQSSASTEDEWERVSESER